MLQARNFATSPVVQSPASSRAPFSTRFAWFSFGLNITLGLGLYQLGQDANQASSKLGEELLQIKEDTASVQRGLRAKIAKLEEQMGVKSKQVE